MISTGLQFIMPFTNEIANALTISKEPGFERVYVPCTHNWKELEEKTIIDVIALTGILWNVSIVGSKHGERAGLAKGFMLIIVAFVIPNVFMEDFVEIFCGNKEDESKCSHHLKLFTGIIFIVLLLACEYFLSYLLNKVNWKKKRN
tara:strand:- start:890 stop:1327 length:438 start_codon:yes stop_codon:yes gene_type:complete